MLAKLENGNLIYAPTNLKLENGGIIVNFNKNIDLMKKYGYKEVIDIQPSYATETQYLTIEGYSETDTEIIVNYKINEKEANNHLSAEAKITLLEERLDIALKQILAGDMYSLAKTLYPEDFIEEETDNEKDINNK